MKILLLLALTLLTSSIIQANELSNSPSPYLAMHGQDPVNWHGLNQKALDRAMKEQKLIFISSGYFACHWCHVMQQESYQDQKIAAYLNQHFIPIKIDREMNPVLDAQLIDFVERTRGVAGWPLNVFLTPDGYPLFGLTYLPPDEFYDVLSRLSGLWKEDPDSLIELARTAAKESRTNADQHNEIITPYNAGELKQAFLSQVDLSLNELEGGFGHGSKFPLTPQIMSLLQLVAKQDFVRTTLDAMSQHHLMDHLSGGFFRYTTDPDWQTPHFEKMLYDNALLARLYLLAGTLLDEERYTKTGIETLHFVIRTLQHPEGGYIASLSAVDNQNIEGGYYLWSQEEIAQALDKDDQKLIKEHWGMTHASRFDTGYLPTTLDTAVDKNRSQLSHIYRQLRSKREQTLSERLPVDDKRLSGWNGLLLSAMAYCSKTGDQTCLKAGKELSQFILKLINTQGLMLGIDREGQSLGPGTLEDYAFVIQGLTDWGLSHDSRTVLATAYDLLRKTRKRFHAKDGWLASQSPLLPGLRAQHNFPDTILPSPTAILLRMDEQLSEVLKQPRLLDSEPSTARITRSVLDEPFSHASLIVLLNESKASPVPD